MKTIIIFLLSLLLVLLNVSCTEVVDIALETSQERLIIDAAINWEKETAGNNQTIILTKTASYYNEDIIYAKGANVSIIDQDNTIYVFEETDDGVYVTSSFIPQFGIDYTLIIKYEEEVFTATEQFVPTSTIDLIVQSTDLGFSVAIPEVTMIFQDNPESKDYYKTKMINTRTKEYDTYFFDDEFWDGNDAAVWFERENMQTGDEIECYVYGISKRFQKYGDKIWNLSGNKGGPFTTPPINVKGNCINTTKYENYPYGYFTMSEYAKAVYLFE